MSSVKKEENYELIIKKLIVQLGDNNSNPEKFQNQINETKKSVSEHGELRSYAIKLLENCIISLPSKTTVYSVFLKSMFRNDPSFVKEVIIKVIKVIFSQTQVNLLCLKRAIQFCFYCFSFNLLDILVLKRVVEFVLEFKSEETYHIILLCLSNSAVDLWKKDKKLYNSILNNIEDYYKNNTKRRLLTKYRTIYKDEENIKNFDYCQNFFDNFSKEYEKIFSILDENSNSTNNDQQINEDFSIAFSLYDIDSFIKNKILNEELKQEILNKDIQCLIFENDIKDIISNNNERKIQIKEEYLNSLYYNIPISSHFLIDNLPEDKEHSDLSQNRNDIADENQTHNKQSTTLSYYLLTESFIEIFDSLIENTSLQLAVNYIFNIFYLYNYNLSSFNKSKILSETVLRYLFKHSIKNSEVESSFDFSKPVICNCLLNEINKKENLSDNVLSLIKNILNSIDDFELIPQKTIIKFICQFICNNLNDAFIDELRLTIFNLKSTNNNMEEGETSINTSKQEYLRLLISYLNEFLSRDKFKECFEEKDSQLFEQLLLNTDNILNLNEECVIKNNSGDVVDENDVIPSFIDIKNDSTMIFLIGKIKDEISNKNEFSKWSEKENYPYNDECFINNLFVILFTYKSKTLSHLRECLNFYTQAFVSLVTNTKIQIQVLKCLFTCWGKSTAYMKLVLDFLLINNIVEYKTLLNFLIDHFKTLNFSLLFINMDYLEFIINHLLVNKVILKKKLDTELNLLKELNSENESNNLNLIETPQDTDKNYQKLISEKQICIEKLEKQLDRVTQINEKFSFNIIIKLIELIGYFIKSRNENVDVIFNYFVNFIFNNKTAVKEDMNSVVTFFDNMDNEEKSEILEEFIYGIKKMIE